MWKAVLTKATDGNRVTITYTEFDADNNPTGKTETNFYDVSPVMDNVFFENLVNSKLDYLNGAAKTFSVLIEGPVQKPIPSPIKLPTEERFLKPSKQWLTETATNQFLADYRSWLKTKALIDAGILVGTEDFVVALKAKVKSTFKQDYIDSI